jgi:alpha-glucosidase
MIKIQLILLAMLLSAFCFAAPRVLTISSPDGNLIVNISLAEKITYSAEFKGKQIMLPSPISMELTDGRVIGKLPVLQKSKTNTVNTEIRNVINGRRASILDNYNELVVNLKGNYSVVFRLYNEGFAYHFKTNFPGTLIVKNEEASFNFNPSSSVYYIPKVQYDNSGEGSYQFQKISEMPDSVYGLTPAVVVLPDGPKIAITESSLFDYAGLNIKKNPAVAGSLIGSFAPEVEKEEPNGWVYKITKRRNYISSTTGQRDFPWRIIVVAENDAQLADCDMVYKLANPADVDTDLSWIKNGKAAWDWWADWNVQGVDFVGEMGSFEYYKYLIDFAAANKLEFVEISVGWMNDQDILQVNPTIRMPELVEYAKSKHVGVMVWVVAQTLERQFYDAFDLFNKLGVAGVKVDFMDADHQGRMNFYEKIAKECMKRKLMVYYHGACKPTGLERTYPCIVNYEGVQANEYNKWSKDETPKHSVNVAFIRNMAGPMDMNCGAMRNAQGDAFAVSNSLPMSQGTRCHQLAMYITYFAPFTMVSDAPDTYITDKHCIDLISSIPTNWNNSKAIDGKIGEYIIMARNHGENWFVSGLNNETERKGNMKLDFLGEGTYTATIFADGVNANRVGTDYKITNLKVTANSVLPYTMANGGGFVMKIEKVN